MALMMDYYVSAVDTKESSTTEDFFHVNVRIAGPYRILVRQDLCHLCLGELASIC